MVWPPRGPLFDGIEHLCAALRRQRRVRERLIQAAVGSASAATAERGASEPVAGLSGCEAPCLTATHAAPADTVVAKGGRRGWLLNPRRPGRSGWRVNPNDLTASVLPREAGRQSVFSYRQRTTGSELKSARYRCSSRASST